MGYYTSYNLTVEENDRFGKEVSQIEIDLLEREIEKMNVFEYGSFTHGWFANAKWYESDADMLLLSKRFPDLIFLLEGDGDDPDDRWGNYYCGGKVMRNGIELVYHHFDQAKLVDCYYQNPRDTYEYQEVI